MSILLNIILVGVVIFIVIESWKFEWVVIKKVSKLMENPKVEMIFKRKSADNGKDNTKS
jgi:hypothetical protein